MPEERLKTFQLLFAKGSVDLADFVSDAILDTEWYCS